MSQALLQTIISLLDSLGQQGLMWSSAAVEPGEGVVSVFWRYPHRRLALRVAPAPDGEAGLADMAGRLRRAIEADQYRLVLLAEGPAPAAREIGGALVEFADARSLRAAALDRIASRDPTGTLAPPTLDRGMLLDAIVRKLAGYAGLSLELASTSLDHSLLNWRSLFDAREQRGFGEGDQLEDQRWRNLAALADELGAAPARIEDALDGLQPRHARIIRLRRGIGRLGKPESAAAVAEILEIDLSRFPAAERAALDALRAALDRQAERLFSEESA